MQKSNSTQKALGAFKKLGAVALITATMFFTACNQAGGGGEKPTPTPTPTKYTVTLNKTANGNVTALPAIPTDKQVAKDTVITFTAKADAGYKIGKWTVTGSALEANTGAEGSSTAKVKITANTIVSVSFEANNNPPNPPTPTKYTVTLNKTEHGTVTASHAIPQDGKVKVDENTVITFTAKADAGYKIGKWTVTPAEALQENTGAEGSSTAKVKITANTTVSVSFKEIPKHAINFSVDSTTQNGTLKAVVSDEEINTGKEVEEGKTVIFTATANSGYRVKGWTLGGNPITEAGTKTEYKLKVTEPATITVSFEAIPEGAILTLAADKNTVSVMAKTEGDSAITVVGCTVETFGSGNQTELQTNGDGKTITLKGNIIELYVSYQPTIKGPLTALDVSGLAKLQKLYCGDNQLTSLNASGLTELNEISCYSNKLTELNVQGCTALQKLACSSNDLPELNVKGLTQLQTLECSNNKLTELDVRDSTVLKNLGCNQNKLTSLKVKGLTALEELNCGKNNLTALDVQGLTKLKNLDCEENQLEKTLDASNLTELKTLNCNDNQLTKLNVQGCTALKFLKCSSNQLDDKAMTKLLNALPQRGANEDNPAIALLYTEETGKTEGNYKDFKTDATPAELKAAFNGAKGRNWKLQKETETNYEDI